MSSFQTPKFIEDYLNLTWRKPPQNFVNTSQFYAGLNPYFINYMNTVVKPCLAYMSGSADGVVNSGIKMNVGYTIAKTAVRLVKGDKIIYQGNDRDCKILSDEWQTSVNFDRFLEGMIWNLCAGTTIIKLNKDLQGRCVPVSERVDRYYDVSDDCGNIIRITIFNSLLFSMKFGNAVSSSFWLVEERFYKNGKPFVRYKVHAKSGVAGQEILPTITQNGLPEKDLPEEVTTVIKAKNIKLNKDMELPFRDGLGVWKVSLTAENASVPNMSMGNPLLYGALDLLWAIDVLFSGTLTDVILGKGKVLVPKRFLSQVAQDFAASGYKLRPDDGSSLSDYVLARTDMQNDDDDTFVYVATERDKDFPPQKVQFDIRSEQYKGMLEIYLRQAVVLCGFAPTSVFPFLSDESVKTATEVTAEENLTRATVQSLHKIISPVLDRLVNEVLYQAYKDAGEEYKGKVNVKLSDYIGNPIQRDENIRNNYREGLIPREIAVQQVNELSAAETQEYMNKLNEDDKNKNQMQNPFDFLKDYGGDNEYNNATIKQSNTNS